MWFNEFRKDVKLLHIKGSLERPYQKRDQVFQSWKNCEFWLLHQGFVLKDSLEVLEIGAITEQFEKLLSNIKSNVQNLLQMFGSMCSFAVHLKLSSFRGGYENLFVVTTLKTYYYFFRIFIRVWPQVVKAIICDNFLHKKQAEM